MHPQVLTFVLCVELNVLPVQVRLIATKLHLLTSNTEFTLLHCFISCSDSAGTLQTLENSRNWHLNAVAVLQGKTAFHFLKCVAIHTVLILCLSFSFLVENVVRSPGELSIFSTVKRPQTSISPRELCDWMPEGENISQAQSS